MQLGFALVPVLAGYWVLKRTHILKHAYEQKTHYRVFFEPALVAGHRDEETHKLVITVEYDEQDAGFRVVVMRDEMASISHFDPSSPYVEWRIPQVS